MKTTNRILNACLLLAVFIAMPAGISAQENFKKSLNDFISNRKIKFASKVSEIKDPQTNQIISMFDVYGFKISKSKKSYFDKIYEAFEKDHSSAYWSMRQDEGAPHQQAIAAVYGDNGAYVTVGANSTANTLVMNEVDKNNSTHRYSYILEWTKDIISNKIVGNVIFLYGKIPQSNNSSGKWKYNGPSNSTYRIKGDSIWVDLDGQKFSMDLSGQGVDVGAMKKIVPFKKFNSDEGENDATTISWLSKFNILKNMYQGDDSALSSTIIAKINDLCKHGGKILSAREKALCVESLEEMKRKTNDKFQKGLLDEAIGYLK